MLKIIIPAVLDASELFGIVKQHRGEYKVLCHNQMAGLAAEHRQGFFPQPAVVQLIPHCVPDKAPALLLPVFFRWSLAFQGAEIVGIIGIVEIAVSLFILMHQAPHHNVGTVLLGIFRQLPEKVPGNIVVAVHKPDILPFGLLHAGEPGMIEAPVFLMGNHPDALVLLHHGGHQLRRMVGGGVIDHNDLHVPKGLIPKALQTPADIGFCVVKGNDYRHQRGFHPCILPFPYRF